MKFRSLSLLVVALLVAGSSATAALADESVFVRGAYGPDDSATGFDDIAAAGFNTVIKPPYTALLDEVASRGLQALVWIGPYDHNTCAFESDDDWVRERVQEVAGHPAIAAYYVDDEPGRARVDGCPDVVTQVRQRSDLVKSIDPENPTYVTLAAGDGVEAYPYQYFAESADIIGLVVYPCNHANGCDYGHIDRAVAEADVDGISRYWAVIQAYGDDWYRTPSYAELRRQLDEWANSRMEGYFLFNWAGLSGFTPAEIAGLDSHFADVPRTSLFHDSVTWLAASGATQGCNPPLNDLFCPDAYVTRAQMAAFLARALDYTKTAPGNVFADDDGSVFEADISRIRAAGVTAGCNPPANDLFCPDAYVTRAQMAAFLFRALA